MNEHTNYFSQGKNGQNNATLLLLFHKLHQSENIFLSINEVQTSSTCKKLSLLRKILTFIPG